LVQAKELLFGAKGGSAARTQRVLGAWEKLRRAVARLLVAGAAAQDLLPQAKLLLIEAMVTRPTERKDPWLPRPLRGVVFEREGGDRCGGGP
jgi:hypothetical protein